MRMALTGLAEFKKIGVITALRSCQLFAGLPPYDLENIAAVTVIKTLPKGGYLFREGDPAIGFYIVQRGSVNVHRVNAAGKEQIIHIFRTGDSFAEVDEEADGFAGGGEIVDALSLVSVVQPFAGLEFNDDSILDQKVCEILADDDAIVEHRDGMLLLYGETELLEFYLHRIPVTLLQKTKVELITDLKRTPDDGLGELI